MITNAFRGHNVDEGYIKMEVYAEHRAIDFAVAYLNELVRSGELNIRGFKIKNTLISNSPASSKGNFVYEVYYEEI